MQNPQLLGVNQKVIAQAPLFEVICLSPTQTDCNNSQTEWQMFAIIYHLIYKCKPTSAEVSLCKRGHSNRLTECDTNVHGTVKRNPKH